MTRLITGVALGIVAGAAFTVYFSPRVPALLWWLFSRGDEA